MPARYSLRLQFAPWLDSDRVGRELEQLCREAVIDEVLFMFTCEELNDGHATLDEMAEWMACLRPWKTRLEALGVVVSLNPWQTFLHGDRSRRFKASQPWQPMVDFRGRAATAQVCPLDPQWRAYFLDTMRLYAAEGYRVIWLEDDMRFHNHTPLEWGGCFCPLHVAAFNERAGTDVTWPQIMTNVLQAGAPHPWRDVWFDTWQEPLLELIAQCRQAIEQHGARLGLMSSSPDSHAMEGRRWPDWWKALAGDAAPVHRPAFCGYTDVPAPLLAQSIARLDQNRRMEPPGSEVGPEVDHCLGQWAQSDQQVAAHLCLSQIFGATNFNVTKHPYVGNLPSDEPTRGPFLAKWKPTLNWLSERFPATLQSHGIGVVWRQGSGRRVQLAQSADHWEALHCPSTEWVDWLAALGLAYQCGDAEHVNALAGPMAWAFEDDELLALLKGGLLLDGEAAHILDARGLGEHIGLSATRIASRDDLFHSLEQFNAEPMAARVGTVASVNMLPPMARVLQGRVHADALEASTLLNPYGERVGHGTVLFENALGGRVASVPYLITGQMDLNRPRVIHLRKVVDYLARGRATGAVRTEQRLVVQFLRDDDTCRSVVWNAGADPCTAFHVIAPQGWAPFGEAFHLTDTADVFPIEHDAGRFSLDEPLRQWERIVIL